MSKEQTPQGFQGNAWVDSKLKKEPWAESSEVFQEKMAELSYKVFFQNPDGADWLRMIEYQYLTNPSMPLKVDRDSMLLQEGIRVLVRGTIQNAQAYHDGTFNKQSGEYQTRKR